MRQFFQRTLIATLALLLNMVLQWVPERWSATLVAAGGLFIGKLVRRLPASLRIWAEAALLGTIIDLQRLRGQAMALAQSLQEGHAEAVPRVGSLSSAEVPTDPSALANDGILAVADGMATKVVAPLFYYWLGGLPAAMLYRLIVENEGMLGAYREEVLRWIQAIPSRLTAAFLVAAAYLAKENGAEARRVVWHSRHQTFSISVVPPAAMAGALGVSLRKGDIPIGEGNRPPAPEDIARAVRLMRLALVLGAGVSLGGSWLLARRRR